MRIFFRFPTTSRRQISRPGTYFPAKILPYPGDSLSSPRQLRACRLSANISFMFGECSFLNRFTAAVDAGFTAVEFVFPYDHTVDALARRVQETGLEIALFHCPIWLAASAQSLLCPDASRNSVIRFMVADSPTGRVVRILSEPINRRDTMRRPGADLEEKHELRVATSLRVRSQKDRGYLHQRMKLTFSCRSAFV